MSEGTALVPEMERAAAAAVIARGSGRVDAIIAQNPYKHLRTECATIESTPSILGEQQSSIHSLICRAPISIMQCCNLCSFRPARHLPTTTLQRSHAGTEAL